MKTFKTFLLLFSILLLGIKTSTAQESQNNIRVTVVNIPSDKGTIQVGLYDNKANFLNKTYRATNVKAKKGSVQVVFKNVPVGVYAISLYHDADNNKELNTLFGIPTESYGTSNNAKGMFGPPKWEDAKFRINNKEIVQSISL
ncbi:DUF2141 domain-containing protein [Aquimarina sediminis]|uniref:DUF2141 domain-containing protein n=1 Tax=Aquimarina sediminis TaxID=2070536 RepID=UPI000CA059F1|nr:DUF2141 domain-containing protein [Aquimarina sediminis]